MGTRQIGFFTACALVVANMIGTGVFSSLGFQVALLPSIPVLMLLWLCGGLVALCGGLSYIQLAKLFPGSGGEYHYIKSAYPQPMAYFSAAVSVFAGFSAPVALSAITFSHYLAQVWSGIDQTWTAALLITVITLIHSLGNGLGKGFQLLSTLAKILVLVVFILAGLFKPGIVSTFDPPKAGSTIFTISSFATCLVYVSFAYSGWNACVYVFGEVKNPLKNIAKSMLIGTCLVTLFYILLNYVFLRHLKFSQIDGVIEIGFVAADAIFGSNGGQLMAGVISLLLISSISAMVWIGPRVIDKLIYPLKEINLNEQGQKRLRMASLLQYLITMGLLFTETFTQLLMMAGVLLTISSSLCVSILFFRRYRLNFKQLIAPSLFLILNLYTLFVILFH